jgi:hypothetical protein
VKHKFKKFFRKPRKVDSPAYIEQAAENAPRITNDTVAEHREEVLAHARKYILPLQHSKHQVVVITTTLFICSVVVFFTYCTLALYKFHSSSTFLYRVTQVIPYPIARVGGNFVAYENYLFELRRYTHFYETQQKTDFSDPKNKGQLDAYKKQALNDVVNQAYVRQLAEKNKVSVSDKEVNDEITIVRNENRLGGSDKVFQDVLKDYWGWSVEDFKRSLRQQMLAQKVAASMDKDAESKVQAAYAELVAGGDFAAIAKKYSDDTNTKDRGGEYGYPIDRTTRTVRAQTADHLFKLKPGQYSAVFNNGVALEIVKNIETNGDKIRAAHIQVGFKDISTYIEEQKKSKKAHLYVSL